MANFRCYPGIWIKLMEDIKSLQNDHMLKAGEVLQVVKGPDRLGSYITFAGKKGIYPGGSTAYEPVYA